MIKKKWRDAFMDVAERFAQLSSAKRLKVGAIIVKGETIVSVGYNGTPSGWSNICEDKNGETFSEVIHAEANAIAKLAKSCVSGEGSTMFITHAPCIHCAKIIYGAGISNVYYKNLYRSDEGIKFLKKCGVTVMQITSPCELSS
jgi:dCMP deaminase